MLSIFILGGCLTSCNHEEAYFEYRQVNADGWRYGEELLYTIDSTVIDTHAEYNLTIEVQHNVSYPFQDIWLTVLSDIDSLGHYEAIQVSETIVDKHGAWKGAGFSSLYSVAIPVNQLLRFSEVRNYHFKVRHAMEDDMLGGVEKIGLRFVSK